MPYPLLTLPFNAFGLMLNRYRLSLAGRAVFVKERLEKLLAGNPYIH